MICPKCDEYKINRSDWFYLTTNFFPAVNKNHVRIKWSGTKQKALLCPNCHGISRLGLIASNLRLIGILVMLVGFTLNVSFERGGVYHNHYVILTWLIGLLGFFMILKPRWFYRYKLELLDTTDEIIIR